MEDMLKADPGGKKVFVDIGCNTGADAIDWFDMWGTQSGAGKKWREGLSTYGSWEGACSQNKLSDAPEIASTPGTGAPTLLCVEPMPSNFKILENLTLATKEFTGSFKAIQAAVSSDEGTVDFPDASDGTENQGIEVNHGHSTVSVKKTTVDALLKEEGLTKVDVLTIDTEGHDPAALKGADGLLKAGNVRFIIFEVHQDIEASIWEKSPLIDEVARLEKYGYDCYFAANTGNVGKLTGCWTEEFEKAYYPVGWSNVACALKGDVWHDVLEKRNKGITAES
jgi:FkbM family methyltransferase